MFLIYINGITDNISIFVSCNQNCARFYFTAKGSGCFVPVGSCLADEV